MFKWPLLSPLCHALPPLSAVGVVVRGVGPLAAERPCRPPLELKHLLQHVPHLTQPLVDAYTHRRHRPVAAKRRQRDVHMRARASGARKASAWRFSSGRQPARATAARQRRHCRSVAIAPSRPLRHRHARAPLSRNACGSSTYPGDAHDETRPAAARARGHSGSAASQSATSAAAARWPAWPARI